MLGIITILVLLTLGEIFLYIVLLKREREKVIWDSLKEFRDNQREVIERFNQNADSYNRTKNTIIDELKSLGEWNIDATKYLDVIRDNSDSVTEKVNEHVNDIKELQEELISKRLEVQRLDKDVGLLKNRNNRIPRKRVIKRAITNYRY